MNLFRVTLALHDGRGPVEFFVTHAGDSLEATDDKVRPMLATLGVNEPNLKQIRVTTITPAQLFAPQEPPRV